MMMKCKDATHLMSEALDRPLGRAERMRLGLHLLLCGGCRAFRQQMDFLRLATRRFLERND